MYELMNQLRLPVTATNQMLIHIYTQVYHNQSIFSGVVNSILYLELQQYQIFFLNLNLLHLSDFVYYPTG